MADNGLEALAAERLAELTADVVSAYVGNNPVPVAELPTLIADVHSTLGRVRSSQNEPPKEDLKPAVSIKKSVTPDHLVCLEDGKKFKSLKRHLSTRHGLTPEEYRAKWNLPSDYPMVAQNHAVARSQLAKSMGLGRKAEQPVKRAGRKKAVSRNTVSSEPKI